MKRNILVALLFMQSSYLLALPDQEYTHIMSTEELLFLAEKNSEAITESIYNELVAQKDIEVARANYFPIIDIEAIDSAGFPGSMQETLVKGLLRSPFRKGAAGGIVAQQLIADFGRTASAIRAAKANVEVAKQNTRVTAYEVKVLALQVFYECARFKKLHDLWKELALESDIITREANHFVVTGQHSIVDKYLSDSETEEARTAQVFFEERLKGVLKELAVITGVTEGSFTCPLIAENLIGSLSSKDNVNASPFVTRAEAGVLVTQQKLKQEQANLWPIITAVGSAGPMQSTNLIEKQNYAVGIGVVMPLFDLNITSRIHRVQAELQSKQQNIEKQKQDIEEMNAQFDEIINATIKRIQHLNIELKIAREGFHVAKIRYFKEQGDLVDLREAWRNLARSSTSIEDARTDLLQAQGAKALLNGG